MRVKLSTSGLLFLCFALYHSPSFGRLEWVEAFLFIFVFHLPLSYQSPVVTTITIPIHTQIYCLVETNLYELLVTFQAAHDVVVPIGKYDGSCAADCQPSFEQTAPLGMVHGDRRNWRAPISFLHTWSIFSRVAISENDGKKKKEKKK